MTHPEILAWRKEQRAQLIPARVAIPDATRDDWTKRIIASLEPIVMAVDGPVSFYWPFRGEPNLRPLMRRMVAAGKTVALPVVLQQRQPLEFRPWTPGCEMLLGVWNIPIPDTRERVTPRLLLAPVVGFDPQRYRLGYGGGFFDRTLAALGGARTVIGVGYDTQALATINPLPHDIPMDRIVTESGFRHEASPAGAVLARLPAGRGAGRLCRLSQRGGDRGRAAQPARVVRSRRPRAHARPGPGARTPAQRARGAAGSRQPKLPSPTA